MTHLKHLHQTAMDLAEQAELARMQGKTAESLQLLQQAFQQESEAAALLAWDFQAEPTRAVLHRSAASLAIDCGAFQTAEKLIITALVGSPPVEIAEELKDLCVKINLQPYLARRGVELAAEQIQQLTT
ncbi:MAG: hypothetical protein F6K30_27150 [Cyanothece sp. SIO2G6]|nr:hypothetical protein [Cyanothece sp. SIO2G6]